MSLRLIGFIVITALMLCLTPCHAQQIEHTSVDLDLDWRAQHTESNRLLTGLYSGSLRLKTGLAPGWKLEFCADHKESSLFSFPSTGDFLVQQATIEKEFGSQRLQLGMVRLPFGIYDYRETYASGLIDYPLARVDAGLNVVDWGVPGAKWTGGSAKFQVDAAAFAGLSSGVWSNRQYVGGMAIRSQVYLHDMILGVSRWDGYINLPFGNEYGSVEGNANAGVHLNGVDLRYTRPHLLVRGELLLGTLGGDRTNGWYLDLYYHLPKYQKFTFVARWEALQPSAHANYGRQITLGVRYTAARDWVLAVNWRRNNANRYEGSWTPYYGKDGSLFFQIYHHINL